jgi:hypothetical protein
MEIKLRTSRNYVAGLSGARPGKTMNTGNEQRNGKDMDMDIPAGSHREGEGEGEGGGELKEGARPRTNTADSVPQLLPLGRCNIHIHIDIHMYLYVYVCECVFHFMVYGGYGPSLRRQLLFGVCMYLIYG